MFWSSLLRSLLFLYLRIFRDATEVHSYPDDSNHIEFSERHCPLQGSPSEETNNALKINPEEDIQFHLFRRFNTSSYILKVGDVQNLEESTYEPELTTKILIHGFQSNINMDSIQQIKDNYFTKEDYNVIAVDWSRISDNPAYYVVVAQLQQVGQYISRLIDFLVDEAGAEVSDFHLIGISLGGQVSGFAGAGVSVGSVGRISGLEPAGLLYESEVTDPSRRLDPSDADFVDVIHTSNNYGITFSVGHVDFYPNGGQAPQPGCEAEDAAKCGVCSHLRAYKYFAESILSDGFVARQCSSRMQFEQNQCSNNITLMGDPVDQSARGDYYLRTNRSPPFAKGSA